MKKVFYITFVCLIFSCYSESVTNAHVDSQNKVDPSKKDSTPEEYFTMKTAKFYDCSAVYRINEINGKKSIITTMNAGGIIDSISPELVTSRFCFVLFSQLRDSSEILYDVYECEIVQSNGDTIADSYTKNQLEMFEVKSRVANQFGECIRLEEYDMMASLFSPEISDISGQFLKASFDPLNSKYGKVNATRLVGFTKFKTKEIDSKQIELFVVKISQERQHKIVTIGIVMNTEKEDLFIYGVK